MEEFRARVLRTARRRAVDYPQHRDELHSLLFELGFGREEIFPPTHAVVRVTREFVVPLSVPSVDGVPVTEPTAARVQYALQGELTYRTLLPGEFEVVRLARGPDGR